MSQLDNLGAVVVKIEVSTDYAVVVAMLGHEQLVMVLGTALKTLPTALLSTLGYGTRLNGPPILCTTETLPYLVQIG